MPTQAADGYGFTFQLCSIDNKRLLTLNLETGSYTEVDQASIETEQDSGHVNFICPFALSLLTVSLYLGIHCFKSAYGLIYVQQPPARAPPNSTTLPPLPPRGPPTHLICSV
jgi:hypothetical protein